MAADSLLPLAGLGALVVRPARDSDAFVDRLLELGCEVHSLPVMAIGDPGPEGEGATQLLATLDDFDRVIVVSRTAAEIVARLGKPVSPEKVYMLAVGAGTASILCAAGFPVTFPADDPTSEGLLALPPLREVRGRRILILRGSGGRALLGDILEQRGAEVVYGNLYRRVCDDRHREAINGLVGSRRVAVAVVHSVEILHCLLAVLGGKKAAVLRELPLLVPGERVARAARQAGCRQLITASTALPETMVDALRGWYTSV